MAEDVVVADVAMASMASILGVEPRPTVLVISRVFRALSGEASDNVT